MRTLPAPLQIIGHAAIKPAHSSTPPSMIPSLRKTAPPLRAYRIDPSHPLLSEWSRHPRLRRSTPLARFLCAAGHSALTNAGVSDLAGTGMIGVMGTGGIQACRKFYQQVIEEGSPMASPAIFPETVYNSPMSHVAAALGIDGPVDTLVGDESSWPMALIHSAAWLLTGKCKRVLVVAGEELDAIALEAYRRAGWYRNPSFVPGEGAGSMVLQLASSSSGFFISNISTPHPYRDHRSAHDALRSILHAHTAEPLEIAMHGHPLEKLIHTLLVERSIYPTVTPYAFAFATTTAWQACEILEQAHGAGSRLVITPGSNHQIAAYTLKIIPA